MLTNPRDAFRGQSRSLNIVPFHMLVIVSYYCEIVKIVTLSLRSAVFPSLHWYIGALDFKKCRDLELRFRGHSRSLNVDRFGMVSY